MKKLINKIMAVTVAIMMLSLPLSSVQAYINLGAGGSDYTQTTYSANGVVTGETDVTYDGSTWNVAKTTTFDASGKRQTITGAGSSKEDATILYDDYGHPYAQVSVQLNPKDGKPVVIDGKVQYQTTYYCAGGGSFVTSGDSGSLTSAQASAEYQSIVNSSYIMDGRDVASNVTSVTLSAADTARLGAQYGWPQTNGTWKQATDVNSIMSNSMEANVGVTLTFGADTNGYGHAGSVTHITMNVGGETGVDFKWSTVP